MKSISICHRAILQWYRHHGRKLPWRRTKDPFRILVSEVMLQQTQVSRVLQKYPPFLRRFPTLSRLALASQADVLRAWQGMGYNNRAVRLHLLAKKVRKEFNGRLPGAITDLQSLPGVGRYTAHAVACFAFHQHVPVVDTNIARVLSRLLPRQRADLWSLAEHVLPNGKAYDWNQALMDLGATVCTASNPRCDLCPLSRSCPSSFRVKPTRSVVRREPGQDGIPNRIYRGRVIELLRNLNGTRFISAKAVGKSIKSTYTRRDRIWLSRLLGSLEEDGLVALRKKRQDIFISFAE